MLQSFIYEFDYGKNKVRLETGLMARQSSSSVLASINDTVVLVTIVFNDEVKIDQDFFPLSVYYQEKFYSSGKIPGSFFRREGRPSDNEVILSRLIDRSIRPLFSSKYLNEIQIVVNVISLDSEIHTDIISIIGVSAALSISKIPIDSFLGVARVGYLDNNFVLNPCLSQINLSMLDLVLSGTRKGILMIDASCNFLKEKEILNAIYYGYKNIKNVIKNISIFSEKYFNSKVNVLKKTDIPRYFLSKDILNIINKYKGYFKKAYDISNKILRNKKIKEIINNLFIKLNNSKEIFSKFLVLEEIRKIERKILINKLVNFNKRIDNRGLDEIRDIDIKIGLLPKRVHGSALFTRGDTQALVTVTLGTYKDAQNFNDLFLGDRLDKFIFHYNFPPYAVGEIGNIGIPKRREIGHGYLAKKGVFPVMPEVKDFPYTVRVVSDILESNGSSSMASVCGASLSLMDAGVPIKDSVSGIAMGLIKNNINDEVFILSDIIGDEDRLGDMDFKVVGTSSGITALQMDMKIAGITCEIIEKSLLKAKEGRLLILDKMNSFISKVNRNLSPFAPKIYTIKINKNQIRNVIGKGGSVIKSLTERYNCVIEVENNGVIQITSNNKKNIINVINYIKEITSQVKIGVIYLAKVIRIVDFGIFVSFLGNKEGLIHISQIYINKNILKNRKRNNKNILNFFKIGQKITVKVLEICSINNKIKLSMRI